MKIKSNKIQCNHCKSVIESKYTHDFVWCHCHKVAVDGGKEYLKRTFSKLSDYTEMSDVDKSEEDAIIAASKKRRQDTKEKNRQVKKANAKKLADKKAESKKKKAEDTIKDIINETNKKVQK